MTEAVDSEAEWRGDRRSYRRMQVGASIVLLLTFAVGAAVQANLLELTGDPVRPDATATALPRLVANLAASAVVIGAIAVWPAIDRRWPGKIAVLLAIEVLGGLVRMLLQIVLGVHHAHELGYMLRDAPAPAITSTISLAVGLVAAEAAHRLRRQERINAHQAVRATAALQRLQAEELRVRRQVAEGLHGSVQQQLVLLETQLRALAEKLSRGPDPDPDDLEQLRLLREEVEEMRETGVRGYSQLLYPSGVDMGLAQAIRILFRRLSSTIAVTLHIADSVVRNDDPETPLPVSLRILAIRFLEEGITNALHHGHAGTLHASASVDEDGWLRLRLDDDGSGDPPSDEAELSGLARLRQQLAEHEGRLEISRADLGGVRLDGGFPLPQRPEPADPGPATS